MYSIKHTSNTSKEQNFLEILNLEKSVYAKIDLYLGASIQELRLKNTTIIKDLKPLLYSDTYASSILFPFANRIKDGIYNFEGTKYQFPINEPGNNNALHGLVFNKTFNIVEKNVSENYASVTLAYHETNTSEGFPFTYNIQVNYKLENDTLQINISVTNTDIKPFPFTLGWHPYFNSSNLPNSSLFFNSKEKIEFDECMITSKINKIEPITEFKIENKLLDDCFVLDSNDVIFSTPNYKALISSTSKNSFLQMYIPPMDDTIAIEPTTGVSDSFNNKIGLQTLNSGDTYNITWTVHLI